MTHANRIWSLPASRILSGPSLSTLSGRTCILELSLSAGDTSEDAFLIFDKVEGYKCTLAPAVNAEARAAAEGTLVEIPTSAWKAEIVAAHRENNSSSDDELRHLMICFEAGPCFEFVCKDFEARLK